MAGRSPDVRRTETGLTPDGLQVALATPNLTRSVRDGVSEPDALLTELPMLTIRAMSDGTGYSARHLEHSDYYAEGERVVGQWQGRGAEMLGISGNVE